MRTIIYNVKNKSRLNLETITKDTSDVLIIEQYNYNRETIKSKYCQLYK